MLNGAGHAQASRAPVTHGQCLGYVPRAEAGKMSQVMCSVSTNICPGVGEHGGSPGDGLVPAHLMHPATRPARS